ncbi:hypothetical protein GCM10027440_21760 [Nocardiopsis coralliicola]
MEGAADRNPAPAEAGIRRPPEPTGRAAAGRSVARISCGLFALDRAWRESREYPRALHLVRGECGAGSAESRRECPGGASTALPGGGTALRGDPHTALTVKYCTVGAAGCGES